MNASPLDSKGLCSLCRLGMRGFDAAYSYGSYDGPLRRLIHLLKYEAVTPLAAPLARMAIRSLPRDFSHDVVTPVPMHWRRRWHRGFNQAELIAQEIAATLHVPMRAAVRRSRGTPPQAELSVAARRRNVAGSFRIRDKSAFEGRRVLLVDDVFTTGATANACAAAIRRAGARSVTVLTVARADRRRGLAILRAIEPKALSRGAGR